MSRAKDFGADMAARDIPMYQWSDIWFGMFREELSADQRREAEVGAEEFERDFNNWLEEITRESG